MFIRRKAAGADLGGVFGNGGLGQRAQLGIAFDEFRFEGGEKAYHVIDDQYLPVAPGRGADTNGGNRHLGGDPVGKPLRNLL